MAYERINWENAPSTETPLNADNLNAMDAAIDQLSNSVDKLITKTDDLEDGIDLANARMDVMVAIPPGSTTENTELLDIRVGANGTSYASAGAAVRGQINSLESSLTEEIDTLNGSVTTVEQDVASIITTIAPVFEPGVYNKGDLVLYNNGLYECIAKTTSGAAWDSSKWQSINVSSLIEYLHDYMARPYASGGTVQIYEVGALCFYDHKLYRALESFSVLPSTPFDSTKWEQVVIGRLITDLSASISDVPDLVDDVDQLKVDVAYLNDDLDANIANIKVNLKRAEDDIIRLAGVVEELSCGLTSDVKTALLACFEKVAWVGSDGQAYYDALEEALDRTRTLSSISVVFTQGSTVIYDTDELYSLKQYLTVTAAYSDGTSREVTNYTLDGSLTAGTSAITVAYNKKIATFNVTVTHQEKILESISAVFNSSASITTNNVLDDLRPHLTVTATYSDSTTNTVSNYTLSGSLNVGTNTITVAYGGMTTTFTVYASEAAPDPSPLYTELSASDFTDTRGFSGFSVSDGTVTYSGALQFSVAALDMAISSVIADAPTATLPRGTWLIFCRVNSDMYYIADGYNPMKLYVFTYDSSTQKFTATQDNSIATVTLGDGYNYSPSKTRIELVDNELLLYDGETDQLIYKVTNANCLGFWAGSNSGVPYWRDAQIKYDMRIPRLSDLVETRTVPEIQIDSSGTITPSSNKQFWLFAFKSGINSIKYHRPGSINSKVAAWIVYKKVDANTYYCTDGNERFRFEYDSANNKFTATNISSETEIQVVYGSDKASTSVAGGMYVTAQLVNNSLKVLSSYGYSFIIPDANCLGLWGMTSTLTYSSVRVGGDI